MDDEMTAASSFAGGDNGNASPQDQPFVSSSSPHPPPLPLSTSTFAFERPGLDNLSESDGPTPSTEDTMDGVSISFIHQPNPDYLGDSTSSVTMSATSVSTDAVAELPTEDEVSLTPFVGEMIAGTHHTQVYGGGVCLACLAAVNGGTIRPEDGPMYGENVPLEDRRQPLK
ncbi:hypothetical protein SEUCBS139899_009260 [Sporothrix eucalyptigena]|uniref:Uncharacterized protein n=1 Tax=Sporothrix eucalyptigena TaxID=1812306 RepID=A0ABP0CRH8_9PEZI